MGVLNFCTSPACSNFCALLSVFCMVVMGGLGILFQNDYEFLVDGVDVDPSDAASKCYQTALVYAGFLGLSAVCMCANRRAAR